jgi:hypothetical protein
MKRRIVTPDAKRRIEEDKHEHNRLVVMQVQNLNLVAQQWVGIVTKDNTPAFQAQRTYLRHVGFQFGDTVQFYIDKDYEAFRHVRLMVAGAASFALPGAAHSAYNTSRGHARVYVLVELAVPPLKPTHWWVPAENLKRQNTWTEIL